jgi:hypothetical protein
VAGEEVGGAGEAEEAVYIPPHRIVHLDLKVVPVLMPGRGTAKNNKIF